MKSLNTTLWFLVGLTTADVVAAHEDNLEERVRAYLLQNPEVILEALETLSVRQAQADLLQKLAAYPDLFQTSALGIGSDGATIKVVEFFDYRCSPCKEVHPKLEALIEENPDLRIEMRHLPILSPGSERAARYALATEIVAGADAYRAVHEALWTMRGPLNEAGFRRIAEELDLEFEAIRAEMQSSVVDAEIDRNRDIAIELGVLGTPAFLSETSVQYGSTDVGSMAKVWLSR